MSIQKTFRHSKFDKRLIRVSKRIFGKHYLRLNSEQKDYIRRRVFRGTKK